MAVVRYPVIVHHLAHYLICHPNPSYKQIAGDPNIIMNEPPIELFGDDMFVAGKLKKHRATLTASTPYAQWYREHPAVVDFRYDAVDGFPILDDLKAQSAFGQEKPGNPLTHIRKRRIIRRYVHHPTTRPLASSTSMLNTCPSAHPRTQKVHLRGRINGNTHLLPPH